MERSVREILDLYHPGDPLDRAWTIPSPWYLDPRIAALEEQQVFARTWQAVGRADEVREKGEFFTRELAGEPLVVVRGQDAQLRAFYNVCRHHAAAVVTAEHGCADKFRCPYHGWTYGTDGALKGMVEFEGVVDFDRSKNGLLPVRAETWEGFVFVCLDPQAASLQEFLGGVPALVAPLRLTEKLEFYARRTYSLECNWKVFVDNYLDGGYHVPHAHKGLSSVVEYSEYKIENLERACLQSSPLAADSASDATVSASRRGRAFYLWLYPNFMLNAYEGVMDTNLVVPLGVDRCEVIFDYYFAPGGESPGSDREESIRVSEIVQEEDRRLCESVQRGLRSRAYTAGRLSVRRETGEHLFHRLLYADLTRDPQPDAARAAGP